MPRSRMANLALSLVLANLLLLASAQSSQVASSTPVPQSTNSSPSPSVTSSSSSSPTPSARAIHTVQVGNGGFKYEPAELKNVSVGDVVTFEFFPPDHSVARAEFGSACVPYEYTGRGKVGFWSSPVYLDDPMHPIAWNLTINSTEPIFFYCTAPGSCKDHQMVGVINPNGTQTLDKQVEAAKKADFMVAPGGKIPSEGTATLQTPAATGSATPATPSGSPAPSSTQAANTPHSHSLSGGAIAGIAVGGIAFLALCAALFFYVGRTRSLEGVLKRHDGAARGGPGRAGDFDPPGYAGSPFPPSHMSTDMTRQGTPSYGEQYATDGHPSGWTSPPMHQHQRSLTSPTPQQMAEVKPEQLGPLEMASPGLDQQSFAAELEAPIKRARA